MRCEKCQGTGCGNNGVPETTQPLCMDCMGSGIAYCCDTAGSNQPNVHSITGIYKPIDLRPCDTEPNDHGC